jgi:hypothetical protein
MTETTSQARRFLLVLCLILLAILSTSLYLDLGEIESKYRTLATQIGRSFFQAINTMREWNFKHGGIYLESADDASPSKYLAESIRSATTTDGRILSMINHAQMTRLLSELLKNQRGIQLHISSLTPLRPENGPDAWEKEVLTRFTHGQKEEFTITGSGGASVFKYMAVLPSDERCQTCHPSKNGEVEMVRGGITVLLPYDPFQKAMAAERRQNITVHGMFLIIGIGFIGLTGKKLLTSIAALQDSLLRIKRLEGFLPICAHCKKIRQAESDRRNQNDWVAIERYIEERTDAEFTHGLCPQCAKDLYPTLFANRTESESPPS